MPENNPEGKNQYGGKIQWPADDVLKSALQEYAKENNGNGLPIEHQLQRIQQAFGISPLRSAFMKKRSRLLIKTVRMNNDLRDSPADMAQAVIDLKASDPQGRWGVDSVKQRLANSDVYLSRNDIRTIMHDYFDDEFDERMPGGRSKAPNRTPLVSAGPGESVHFDGHEKLGHLALNLGQDIGLPIYGCKDKYSGFIRAMTVLPNVRKEIVIAHWYLDLVEAYGYEIPITMVTDKGSEVGLMGQIHTALRLEAAPEYKLDDFPALSQIPSTRNTPIEGIWRWQREGEGHNLREVIQDGVARGLLVPGIELHANVFNWLFPPLVQDRLDAFQDYWNSHKVSRQKNKLLPSGTSPSQLLAVPESGNPTARHCWIKVVPESVRGWRADLGGLERRDEIMAFVSDEFHAEADAAWLAVGSPQVTISNVWSIFSRVVEQIQARRSSISAALA